MLRRPWERAKNNKQIISVGEFATFRATFRVVSLHCAVMKFVITDTIRQAISVASSLKSASAKEISRLQAAEAISLGEVTTLSQLLRTCTEPTYQGPKWVHELLHQSEPYVEPVVQTEKDPVLVARLRRLQDELDNRKYMKMVKDVSFLKVCSRESRRQGKFLSCFFCPFSLLASNARSTSIGWSCALLRPKPRLDTILFSLL